MSDAIRILLVDDQRLMRDGLRLLLELEPDLQVVAEADNGVHALELYAAHAPDVVLMDIRMPEMDGVAATKKLQAQWPDSRVLILTTFDDDQYVFDGIRAGALGYLLKDVSGEELATAVRTIANGGALIGPSVARKVLGQLAQMPAQSAQTLADPLTEREQEILMLMGAGLSNPKIARRLHLAEGTVKNYVSSILQKTGTNDRTQAVLWAKEAGLL